MIRMNCRTKSLLEPNMKKLKKYFRIDMAMFLAMLFFTSLIATAQTDDIPAPPKPPRLVNDFAGFLNPEEQSLLERKLVAFDDSTSTQIAIVIVKSLNGYEISDMGTRIIEKWGIGEKGKNNGILILIKPKTQDEKGGVAISTGYGIESFVTDALSKRIIEQEIVPSFREGQYYLGLDRAVNVLMSITRGQFTADQYLAKKGKGSKFPVFIIIIMIVLLISIFNRNSSNGSKNISSRSNVPFWLLMGGLLGSGSSSGSGSYGDFNSGGGGFGGFGGGSGGGGGASGSW